ncbi:MAG: site-specific DNA-methyltransferase [Bacteroidales bacterium]|nr:site-specific DNA-methyltransferase [Bacteroidales bacterium]MCF8326936.1 site-specific DNA-methyltransferase [Bacteroidales bacterium]
MNNSNSYHHKNKRAHIPSKEEAGYEEANPNVKQGKETMDIPKNPVVHRGQDPELFWLNKYGKDDLQDRLQVDIRSLYRHEHIAPERLIEGLYKTVEEKPEAEQGDLFANINETFGNALQYDELDKVSEYYKHSDGWSNRLIQGDSLTVMSSLLEREGMAGQVQTIYIDPPYGIKYNSNWQMKLNDRNVKDGSDDHLSGEPEMIKAYRDTWELGIHSYLSYLRDRLLVAKELLKDSGSCFVQISDENVHLVRNLMDEVFGSENFVSQITFRKTTGVQSNFIATVSDFIIWYAKDRNKGKFRQLFRGKGMDENYKYYMESPPYKYSKVVGEIFNKKDLPEKVFRFDHLLSSGKSNSPQNFEFEGKVYTPPSNNHWKTNIDGMKNLANKNRIYSNSKTLSYIRYLSDFPLFPITNLWEDTTTGGSSNRLYVVQTVNRAIERCVQMTTDPGDLVLDPTCGSGTTAFIAEQWGRRWITIDTSRIALNITKQRLMTATFPYYHLYSDVNVEKQTTKENKIKKTIKPKLHAEQTHDLRQGFVYEEVPHITLKSLANDEEPETETLYDKPYEDKKRMRVSGPFTVETLQSFEPVNPEELEELNRDNEENQNFEQNVFEHLKSAGVKNGIRGEKAVFNRVERLTSPYLHAEGFYQSSEGEKKAYMHIGPKFGTVAKRSVSQAVKECRQKGDADWLIVLGFSFDSDIENMQQTTSMGSFEITKVRMNDDLMQEGLMKKDKKAGSFITIGEPDVDLVPAGDGQVQAEIKGLDIYDPIKDQVKARNIQDIAYWMVDDDYDGSNFIVKQVFFCGGSKEEFKKWKKGLDNLAKQNSKKKAERTLKIEIDDEAFDRLYGFKSHPIETKKDQKIAVRVVSQFGEESTKVLEVE